MHTLVSAHLHETLMRIILNWARVRVGVGPIPGYLIESIQGFHVKQCPIVKNCKDNKTKGLS